MTKSVNTREIEANFVGVDIKDVKRKIVAIGAMDVGEVLIHERIFDFVQKTLNGGDRFVRLRSMGGRTTLTYKHHQQEAVDGTEEIEFGVDDLELAALFVQRLGLTLAGIVEKKRHNFRLGDVTIDIDIWPTAEPLLQIEGPSEARVKEVAKQLGLDWNQALFGRTKQILIEKLGLDLDQYTLLTFDKVVKEPRS